MNHNSFSVRVPEGTETESGYVEMKHGTQYTLLLSNHRRERCDARVCIDGKHIGTWRIEGRGKITIERPVEENKRFTFYKMRTKEAEMVEAGDVDFSERGLISVEFRPETAITSLPRIDDIPWKNIQIGRGDWTGTSRSRGSTLTSMSYDAGYKGDETFQADYRPQECVCDDSTGTASINCCSGEIKSRSILRGCVPTTKKREAGVTGLSGYSDQEFESCPTLNYDEERFCTINLRLVAVQDQRKDPVPLRPVNKSTPVPPPVFII